MLTQIMGLLLFLIGFIMVVIAVVSTVIAVSTIGDLERALLFIAGVVTVVLGYYMARGISFLTR